MRRRDPFDIGGLRPAWKLPTFVDGYGQARASWFTNASPERIAEWRLEAVRVDRENDELGIEGRISKFHAEARELYGRNHRVVAYLEKYPVRVNRVRWVEWLARQLDAGVRVKADEEKARATIEQTRRAASEAIGKAARAVVWLIEHGKKPGVDFAPESAVVAADDLAWELEIARQLANGPISFDGDDECEGCAGWDGVSRRCACGNRRVEWERRDGHSFESPYVYAEAW